VDRLLPVRDPMNFGNRNVYGAFRRRLAGMTDPRYEPAVPRRAAIEGFAGGARSEPQASEGGWTGFAGPGPEEL
jgi:hypothetical protein